MESQLKVLSSPVVVEQEVIHPVDNVSRNSEAAWIAPIDDNPDNSSCSNDSGIFGVKSNPIHNVQNLQHTYSSSYSSSESENCTDSYTSDDSSGENESPRLNSSTSAISLSMGHCSLNYVPPVNATEKPLSKFEGFISNEWPEGWRGELEVLHRNLTHGGDFSTDMEVIDLSTPACVRLDSTKVLDLLESKIMNSESTLEHVGKLFLPNVRELASGDEVKAMIEDYCRVLRGQGTKVRIEGVIIKCDEVSAKFVPGDTSWIEGFRSYNNLGTIAILCAKGSKKSKEFTTFCLKLCGMKKIDHYFKEAFIRKRSSVNDYANTPKRQHIEVSSTADDSGCPHTKKMYSDILWKQWETVKLHDKDIDGTGVTIALLDSGINITHKAFEGKRIIVNDVTGIGNIDLTTDPNGHGTLCASIACGLPFQSVGQSSRVPAGVAPEANIVIYKITDKTGKAHTAVITKALNQCLEDKDKYNIDIVLLPYGSDSYDYNLCEAIDALVGQGVLVVTASGNRGKLKDISYPARFGHTICVGAHDKYGNTTCNTSKGRALDFTAPGENLTGASSVHPTMFTTESGTSFAAECVAGLLALMIQRGRDIPGSEHSGVQPSIVKLLHHQDTMKKILRSISRNSKHKESDGYGCLQPTEMLLDNRKFLELLYKDFQQSS